MAIHPPSSSSSSPSFSHHHLSSSPPHTSISIDSSPPLPRLRPLPPAHPPSPRLGLLNSAFWLSLELCITLGQILAAVVVLAISQHEKPETPLPAWVIGYAVGCSATLPLLYWRYTHHPSSEILEHEALPVQHHALWVSNTIPLSYPADSQLEAGVGDPAIRRAAYPGLRRGGRFRCCPQSSSYPILSCPTIPCFFGVLTEYEMCRFEMCMERLRISLDCFFAVWFVLGNVWVFGRPSSAEDSPKLYRLCLVFLTLSCVSYAMPFILCAAVCCCLPCVISLMGFRESQVEGRGATADVIGALPIYKFKSKRVQFRKENNESHTDTSCEGGVMAAGTEKERVISGDDAACCICLGRYRDNAELRGLPCTHHFHVECVDQWLKINASCPLCKFAIQGGKEGEGDPDASAGGGSGGRRAWRLFEEV